MKRFLPIVLGSLLSCAPIGSHSSSSHVEQAPLADAVRFGSCAPVRYRALVPGELEAAEKPPAKEAPLRFSVRSTHTRSPTHRSLGKKIASQLEKSKDGVLRCVADDVEEGRMKILRVSVTVSSSGARLSPVGGLSNSARRICAEKEIRRALNKSKLTAQPNAFLRFHISVGPRAKNKPQPPGPRRRRGTVEVLSSSDRAPEALSLTGHLIESREKLERCLGKTKQRGSARAIATLTIEKGQIRAAEVETGDDSELAECWAGALSGAVTARVGDGGYQCALVYASSRQVPIGLTLVVDSGGLIGSDGEQIAIDPHLAPPSSPLYRGLLAKRFADAHPSPAPALLHVDPRVSGAAIVAVARAARAADIEIVSVLVAKTDAKAPQGMRADGPIPRLGRFGGRVALLTAIVGKSEVWLGLGQDMEARTIPAGNLSELASHARAIAAMPGVAGRSDAVVAVEADASASMLEPVLAALRAVGRDQFELVSAENARTRLAR